MRVSGGNVRWRFGYNDLVGRLRPFWACAAAVLIWFLITADDATPAWVSAVCLSGVAGGLAASEWVGVRNHVSFDDDVCEVRVMAQGVLRTAAYADSIFVIPAKPSSVPAPVRFETDGGVRVRCGLMSQGRFFTPPKLRRFRSALAARGIRVREG